MPGPPGAKANHQIFNVAPGNVLNFSFNSIPIRRGPLVVAANDDEKAVNPFAKAANPVTKAVNPVTKAANPVAKAANPVEKAANLNDDTNSGESQDMDMNAETHWREGEEIDYN
ncbi:hypothetical protein BCON_0192g00220 [Botryotinia convoluta]|uniref:Uncharacterized protein n=1 Tax=Botryotinia convoluta TaxID=54673 RepID=A0A4Z1HMI6_9HELO|nr:hypothetical protein BCON_0192g00220 [Botryotinia convoluta]